jgi:hypothetical protein
LSSTRILPHILWALVLAGLLASCAPPAPQPRVPEPLAALEQEIAAARRELLQLTRRKPSATPETPANQPPRITRLEARLGATHTAGDSAELSAEARDPEGQSLSYQWESRFPGLTADNQPTARWFPDNPALAGQTGLITLTVTDSAGASSSATLMLPIQADGRLSIPAQSLTQPVLETLTIEPGANDQLTFTAQGSTSDGSPPDFHWQASRGQLSHDSGPQTRWQPRADESGEIEIQLELSSTRGRTRFDYRFQRNPGGGLSGDFRTIRHAVAPVVPAVPEASQGLLQGQLYALQANKIVSLALASGQTTVLYTLGQAGAPAIVQQLLFDQQNTLYLRGAGQVYALSLSSLELRPIPLPQEPVRTLFFYQGQACALVGQTLPGAYTLDDGRKLPFETPEWLLAGPVSSSGQVVRNSGLNFSLADPRTGVSRPLHTFSSALPLLSWHPDGQRLLLLEAETLYLADQTGLRQQPWSQPLPRQVLWLNDTQVLAIAPEKSYLFNPETAEIQPLTPALHRALVTLDLPIPG